MPDDSRNEYLTPADVSRRWGERTFAGTLAQWRSRKTGPAWSKMGGRVLYAVSDVEAYEAAQRRQGSAAN